MSEKSEYSEKSEFSSIDDKKIAIKIDEWLDLHWDEGFIPEDILRYYNWKETRTKKAVYNRLRYLTKVQEPPTLKKSGKQYRIIDRDVDTIKWKDANPEAFFDITLPFDLHKYIRLHKRSVMIVGGVSNQGKTAFAHNVISLNWDKHKIALWDSENSAEELAGRFCHYPDYEQWADDFVKDRSSNFSDVIEPDALNIIDYLEIQDNFYLVGKYIREIRDSLRDGIAIVLLQKSESSALPIGREFSRHLPRCVITIDKGMLTIVKAKDRAQKTINPINMKWSFGIDNTGTQFINIERSYGSEQ